MFKRLISLWNKYKIGDEANDFPISKYGAFGMKGCYCGSGKAYVNCCDLSFPFLVNGHFLDTFAADYFPVITRRLQTGEFEWSRIDFRFIDYFLTTEKALTINRTIYVVEVDRNLAAEIFKYNAEGGKNAADNN